MSNPNLLPMMPGLNGCYYKPRAPPQSNTKGLTQGLHSTSVPDLNISVDEKAVLGSRWAPIEIADDSPIRDHKAPYQHHQTQRTKRAREDQSDAEVYSDASNNMKKAKLMHQPQYQIINRSQNGRELPLLQIDLNSPIFSLATLDDDTEFEEKELLFVVSPARAMTKEGFDDFFYEGESIKDFVGMKDFRVQEIADHFISTEDFRVQESADGCWYEKESTDDFSGKEEDTGVLLESLGSVTSSNISGDCQKVLMIYLKKESVKLV